MKIILTKEMLAHYLELNKRKKEIEAELEELKKTFIQYFDESVGKNVKGEVLIRDYKLQRQIRKIEKYDQETTLRRLEELNLNDLIKKSPDEKKIKSAIDLGILQEEELKDCKIVNTSQAIYVKNVD
ncbi:hypothetical protein [Robertmurraya andreesenii]|uniref:Phage protein n=1 Tax=Anoxybacillus andreesenii TaxID=1325932 RepID=A0ABT9V708_9BACL|nr:hypothetical protein [Robertmurraya andreesenii]MDQ0156724.1 hypothetical protein [Robertmurraya andreesenii]